MFQDEGASTARTGTEVSRSASMTAGKGSRTEPVKEKPKMASIMWSVVRRAEETGEGTVKDVNLWMGFGG